MLQTTSMTKMSTSLSTNLRDKAKDHSVVTITMPQGFGGRATSHRAGIH